MENEWQDMDDELHEQGGKPHGKRARSYRSQISNRERSKLKRNERAFTRNDRRTEREAKQGVHAEVQDSEGNEERMSSQGNRR